jgi:hypothetical protein
MNNVGAQRIPARSSPDGCSLLSVRKLTSVASMRSRFGATIDAMIFRLVGRVVRTCRLEESYSNDSLRGRAEDGG